MIPLIGNIALILALFVVILQLFAPARYYGRGAMLVFSLVLLAFLCLIYSYIVSDFSVLNVYNNSHNAKPLLYKITGAWGNHEGSMLLLVLILCGYNLVLVTGCNDGAKAGKKSYFSGTLWPLTITAYLTQLLITAGFLVFLIVTSNPFMRIFPPAANGLGLNPLLQDVGLAIHPPMLYFGYIGFSVVFSLAIAALIHGEAGEKWARQVRLWTLASWSLLTLGIGLGSWWAYRELGWGGFWFWDPVENVSLMPWLAAAGLYHSLLALEKRGIFALWSILLAIITFCLSLLGIFLVRSGVVSSVHAFASDPSRGVFILGFLGLTGLLAFTLFALRAGKFSKGAGFTAISRETALLLNNIFFVTLSATVLLGTMYPIFLQIFSATRVAVGAPYFNATFNYMAVVMLLFTAIAPAISWSGASSAADGQKWLKLALPLIVGVVAGGVAYIKGGDGLSVTALFVAVFLITATMRQLIDFKNPQGKFLKTLPPRAWGMVIAHCGAAVLVIGITITTGFGVEKEQVMTRGQQVEFAGYTAILLDGSSGVGDNYFYRRANFRIMQGDREIATLHPEIRLYPVEGSTTLEADICYSLLSNIYVAIGEIDKDGVNFATRVYYKPMVNLIWLGCIMMAAGGLLACRGRRRVL